MHGRSCERLVGNSRLQPIGTGRSRRRSVSPYQSPATPLGIPTPLSRPLSGRILAARGGQINVPAERHSRPARPTATPRISTDFPNAAGLRTGRPPGHPGITSAPANRSGLTLIEVTLVLRASGPPEPGRVALRGQRGCPATTRNSTNTPSGDPRRDAATALRPSEVSGLHEFGPRPRGDQDDRCSLRPRRGEPGGDPSIVGGCGGHVNPQRPDAGASWSGFRMTTARGHMPMNGTPASGSSLRRPPAYDAGERYAIITDQTFAAPVRGP